MSSVLQTRIQIFLTYRNEFSETLNFLSLRFGTTKTLATRFGEKPKSIAR